jgi:hypothetical protein
MIRIKSPLTQAVDVAKAWAFPDVGYGPLERSDLRRMTREIISAYLEAAAAEIKNLNELADQRQSDNARAEYDRHDQERAIPYPPHTETDGRTTIVNLPVSKVPEP